MQKLKIQAIPVLMAVLLFITASVSAQILVSPASGATDISTNPTLQWTGTAGTSTVQIIECPEPAASVNLNDYQLAQGPITMGAIADDLSGITYNQQTNTLQMITNGTNEAIYETDLNGNILKMTNLWDQVEAGNSNAFYDTEDIVHLYGNTYAVVEERKGRIAIIDIPPTSSTITYNTARIIQLPGNIWGANDGLEGITYNPATNTLYVVKEKTPKAFYEIPMPTSFPHNPATVASPCDLNAAPFNIVSDVAAIHYVGLTSGFTDPNITDNMLILSEEMGMLLETDANCNIISTLTLPGGDFEGVTMDNNGNIYLVREPNKFYIYSNPNPSTTNVVHSATVSGSSYTVPANVLNESTEYCWQVTNNGNTSAVSSFTTEGPIMVCTSIQSANDDVEEIANGNMYQGSTDIELIYDGNNGRGEQKIGLRFNNVDIPNSAIIESAYIQFTADETSSGTVNLTIRGENSSNAAPFSTTNNYLSTRPTTNASVVWSPPNWNSIAQRGAAQKTPDLTNIVQEIVNKNGFDENSSMVFILSGSGTNKRVAESYEGVPSLAAELCVSYTIGQGSGPCIEPVLNVWLEGTYDVANDKMTTGLNDNFVLPQQSNNPNGAFPYNQAPWNYAGTTEMNNINGNYASTAVDWVMVSFRTGPAAGTEVFETAALLQTNGRILFTEQCPLPAALLGVDLYTVIDHRNHMVVMSDKAVPMTPAGGSVAELVYDFRQQDSYSTATTTGQKQVSNSDWVMLAGDMDADYDINGADKIIWADENGVFGQYRSGDLNLNGDTNGGDKIPWEVNAGTFSGVPQ